MYGITDLNKGVYLEYQGAPYVVISSEHSKLGRGGGMQRVKMRNLISGSILDVTFKGADKIPPARIDYKQAQFLYKDGSDYNFMDLSSFEQFAINESDISQSNMYLKEGEEYSIAYYKGKPIGLNLPIKIKLKVTTAEAGLKGDTATSPTKTIELENGLKIQAPLFIKQGDEVIVDTRDGKYVSRA